MKSIRDRLSGSTVFSDVGKLSFDYVPENLVHRDEEGAKLATIFRPVLFSGMSQNALVTGNVGQGKTALAKRFCMTVADMAGDAKTTLNYVYINCRQQKTSTNILHRIISEKFDRGFPDRGFSVEDSLRILKKHLQKRGSRLIIIMDEIDVHIKKEGSDLLYKLTRFEEEDESAKGMVSIMAVSQKLIFSMLEDSVVSTFRRTNTVEMPNYDREQLRDLLSARVELAFRPGAVEDGVVELLSDIAAAEGGDARFAIELLHTAGQVAEEAGVETVTPENARAAKAHIRSFVDEVRLSGLDTQKRLVLLAISRCLGRKAYTTTGEVEERYALACEEYGQKPRAHTQFWNYLKDLDAQSLIDAKRSSEGMVGTTTVISLPDIPAAVLEEKLMSMLGRERS